MVQSNAEANESIIDDQGLDVLTEIVNIGVGRAAAVLNRVVNAHVSLSVPSIELVSRGELAQRMTGGAGADEKLSWVELGFDGDMQGAASLMFPRDDAEKLVSALVGEAVEADWDEARVGTLTEVGNIVLNGIMGSLANMSGCRLNYTVPTCSEGTVEVASQVHGTSSDCVCLVASARFVISALGLDGSVVLFFDLEQIGGLVETLLAAS
ncbi:MAG: chemotaxis protein CheX [Nannocystaceae bacterium]